jgi:hypothetical protein
VRAAALARGRGPRWVLLRACASILRCYRSFIGPRAPWAGLCCIRKVNGREDVRAPVQQQGVTHRSDVDRTYTTPAGLVGGSSRCVVGWLAWCAFAPSACARPGMQLAAAPPGTAVCSQARYGPIGSQQHSSEAAAHLCVTACPLASIDLAWCQAGTAASCVRGAAALQVVWT